MADNDTEHPREDDRNDELDGSPAPDPEADGDAEDVPEADWATPFLNRARHC